MACREESSSSSWTITSLGELPDDARAGFEAHLAHCVNCTAYLMTYGQTARLAKEVYAEPEGPLPDDVPEELIRAILEAYAQTR